VGAGASSGATGNTPSNQSATGNRQSSTENRNSTSSTASGKVSASGSSYHLEGVKNPNQYNNKQVEVIGTVSPASKSGDRTLRVTSVRIINQNCQ
jgi:hypothetical protein